MKTNTFLTHQIVVTSALLVLIAPRLASANAESCSAVFASSRLAVPAAQLSKQLAENYQSPNIEALRALLLLKTKWPGLSQERALVHAVETLLKDEEASIDHLRLTKILNETAAHAEPSLALLTASLETELASVMTVESARARAALLQRSDLDKALLQRALGSLTQKESLEALIGKKGLREIEPTSLVGRFIEASKADRQGGLIKTVVTKFRTAPEGEKFGEERIFISVDDRNIGLAQKFFGDNANLLIHNHEDQQGTLELHHRGHPVSYARYLLPAKIGGGDIGTIMPIIALSTKEASATFNYFTLGTLSNKARAKYPWSLKNENGETYCRPGGYTTCTHWFGEMPVGELGAREYSFPGIADEHAYQRDESAKTQSALRTGPLGDYTHFDANGRQETVGLETRVDRLTRMVWREREGHQQMWQMLNAKAALRKGELANPGWVMYTLLAKAPTKRVPVVLVHRENATRPFTKAEVQRLESSIDAY